MVCRIESAVGVVIEHKRSAVADLDDLLILLHYHLGGVLDAVHISSEHPDMDHRLGTFLVSHVLNVEVLSLVELGLVSVCVDRGDLE